ncbi:prephenate dehydratase [Thalassobaculum fulvum]|jgi:prephenate dehydratase|uniref:prephenate dehydratase n=1 Tax=Thalassobaculum fulvum TaxID=1633335 RepID=A0A918XV01_9PROT|nr:prephenate dehydratase [Thalassobaculum fulvum]GHD56948.1 prephenate dehydratase [Thalassobaculum fulvum]
MSRKPIVAYQGIAGAYSHLACTNALPDHEPMPCQSFEDMLAAVQEGEADRAMVPVENSVAGRVADIHHLLPESGLFIVGEYFQRVNHMLLGLPGTRLDELKEVRAHPQGLAQCRKLIKRLGLKRVNHADNAGAAHEVAALGDKSVAAIASSLAAGIYGLEILEDSVEDAEHNTTRFLVMARQGVMPPVANGPCITTMVFQVRSVPAALYKALGGFATNGINLTKLESYIIDGSFSAAQFYIDAEGHQDDPAMQNALDELRFFCPKGKVRILGTYPASPFRTGGGEREA